MLRIERDYVPGISVEELVDTMALGLDFTLRDIHNDLQKEDFPGPQPKVSGMLRL